MNNSSVAMEPADPVTVEAYSVVLSTAALLLSVFFGGGGILAILLALFRTRGVGSYSCTLLLVFCFLCAGLDWVWCLMELAHLLFYHYALSSPTGDFGVATYAVYIFLCTGIGSLITAFCVENVLRLSGRFGARVYGSWPVMVCVAMFLVSLLVTLAILYASLDDLGEEASAYLPLSPQSSSARVTVLGVLVAVVVVAMVLMTVAGVMRTTGDVKNSDSYVSTDCNNEPPASLPHFFLKQTEVTASGEGVDRVSTSPPSLTKLSDAAHSDVMSPKGRNSTREDDIALPGLRGSSMLGVNMTQIFIIQCY